MEILTFITFNWVIVCFILLELVIAILYVLKGVSQNRFWFYVLSGFFVLFLIISISYGVYAAMFIEETNELISIGGYY